MANKPGERAPAPRASGAQWAGGRERGSPTLLKMMMWVALRLGRPPARCILYLIAAYFFVFAPAARRNSRAYLRRALGREPTGRDRFRQVFAFASTILDRLYLVKERYALLDVTAEGEELMREAVARGKGALLLGAHLGKLRDDECSRPASVRVCAWPMAMYEDNANRVRALFGAGNPGERTGDHSPRPPACDAAHPRLLERRHLRRHARRPHLRRVACACRELSWARRRCFPPARACRCGLALPGNVHHRPLSRQAIAITSCSGSSPTSRNRLVADARRQCARRSSATSALLEEYCRSDPYNWFNFYDFWHGAPTAGPAAPTAAPPGDAAPGAQR